MRTSDQRLGLRLEYYRICCVTLGRSEPFWTPSPHLHSSFSRQHSDLVWPQSGAERGCSVTWAQRKAYYRGRGAGAGKQSTRNEANSWTPMQKSNRWTDVILPWLSLLASSYNKCRILEKLLANCQPQHWVAFWGKPPSGGPSPPFTFSHFYIQSLLIKKRGPGFSRARICCQKAWLQVAMVVRGRGKSSRKSAGVSLDITSMCCSHYLLSLGSSEVAPEAAVPQFLAWPLPFPSPPVHMDGGRYLPARFVLAPVEAGEELLLVSPARDVRLEWRVGVGRFNLLPVDGITLKKNVKSPIY